MAKETNYFNADAPELAGALTFQLDGVVYNVGKLTQARLDEMSGLGEKLKAEKAAELGVDPTDADAMEKVEVSDVVPRQLACLCDCEPERFRGADLRQLTGILGWILDRVKAPLEGKAKNG